MSLTVSSRATLLALPEAAGPALPPAAELPEAAAAGSTPPGLTDFLSLLGLAERMPAEADAVAPTTDEGRDEAAADDGEAVETPAVPLQSLTAMSPLPTSLHVAAVQGGAQGASAEGDGPIADEPAVDAVDAAAAVRGAQVSPVASTVPRAIASVPPAHVDGLIRGQAATPRTEPAAGALPTAPKGAANAGPSPQAAADLSPVRMALSADAPIAVPSGLSGVAAATGLAGADLPALTLSPSTPTQWRQPLAEVLGERVQWSLRHGSDQAVIRLDPPQLGRIEIAIRHEAGALHVQMSATHGEVVRQLHAIGDHLRQDLNQRAYGDVSVVVSDAGATARDADGRSRGGRQPQHEHNTPGRALAEAEAGPARAFHLASDTSEIR